MRRERSKCLVLVALPLVAGVSLAACSSPQGQQESNIGTQALVAPAGSWKFDDCVADSTALADSSGAGLTATRTASASCVVRPNGGKAVLFAREGDKVSVPAGAVLRFGRNLGVAAWIDAATIDSNRVHTIIRQGTGSDDVIAFQIGHGRLELALKVPTPGTNSFQVISEKVWDRSLPSGFVHVAATWDGTTIRLFINGKPVRENRWFATATDIVGTATSGVEVGSAPPRAAVSRQFLGTIDEVWISGAATSASDIAALFAPAVCAPEVDRQKELMITDLGVVEDPLRATGSGPWTFKHLMESMAPTPADAPEMVRQMLTTWLSPQTVNGQIIPARQGMNALVLGPWLNGGSTLDLSRAPMRLLAIVNRLDLRNLSQGKAGEGRFVFGVLNAEGSLMPFTVILEYRLPASSEAEVLVWARRWHDLNALTPGTTAYNSRLAEITELFAGRGAEPGRVNGSALSQLRTNEIALSSQTWELREFVLSGPNGFLRPDTVKLTPGSGRMGQPIVASFINQNEAAIIAEQHVVPDVFAGVPFLGANSINLLQAWRADGINSNEARHKFSLNTCNGCHGNAETGTPFLQINPRNQGEASTLAGFLTGIDVVDPVDPNTSRHFDDLGRRVTDMERLLCSTPGTSALAAGRSFIAKGINRVH